MTTHKAGLLAPSNTTIGAAWLSDQEQEVWQTMISVHARLVGRLDAALQAANNISLRDFEVLAKLAEAAGGSLRMAELADLLFVSPSGLTRRLDGLVQDGLVKRQACMSDRRGTLAVLSAAGRAAFEDAAPTHAGAVRRYVFDVLDHHQLDQWDSCVRTLIAGLPATDRSGSADHPARSAS